MSLNALMRWLKPREMIFFDLLESAAANIYQASSCSIWRSAAETRSGSRSCGGR